MGLRPIMALSPSMAQRRACRSTGLTLQEHIPHSVHQIQGIHLSTGLQLEMLAYLMPFPILQPSQLMETEISRHSIRILRFCLVVILSLGISLVGLEQVLLVVRALLLRVLRLIRGVMVHCSVLLVTVGLSMRIAMRALRASLSFLRADTSMLTSQVLGQPIIIAFTS